MHNASALRGSIRHIMAWDENERWDGAKDPSKSPDRVCTTTVQGATCPFDYIMSSSSLLPHVHRPVEGVDKRTSGRN